MVTTVKAVDAGAEAVDCRQCAERMQEVLLDSQHEKARGDQENIFESPIVRPMEWVHGSNGKRGLCPCTLVSCRANDLRKVGLKVSRNRLIGNHFES